MIFYVINFNENVFGKKMFLYSSVFEIQTAFLSCITIRMGNMTKGSRADTKRLWRKMIDGS